MNNEIDLGFAQVSVDSENKFAVFALRFKSDSVDPNE